MAALKTYFLMVAALLLAVYVNYPAPSSISNNLSMWKTKAAKTIIFNKNKVFYKDEPGTKLNAPVLVCLHGFPTSSYDWLKVWPGLLEKFSRVIAPDFLGFGFSDKPADHDYSIIEQADLVEHLLQIQRIKEVHLLAHDYGDTVAQELLARYEERLKDGTPKLIIKSVCLLNGGIFPETNFPLPMQQVLMMPYIGSVLARLVNIYTFKRSFGSIFGPQKQPTDDEFNDFWTLIRKNDGNLVLPKLLQYIPERMAQKYRWTGVLQKTKVPVHVIYGPADPVNPPGFVSFYRDVVPDASITVLQGHVGHYPQWEDSAECMLAYFTFLRSLPFSGESQLPPNITTATRITEQMPLPKMVHDKMKMAAKEQQTSDGSKDKFGNKKETIKKMKKALSETAVKEGQKASDASFVKEKTADEKKLGKGKILRSETDQAAHKKDAKQPGEAAKKQNQKASLKETAKVVAKEIKKVVDATASKEKPKTLMKETKKGADDKEQMQKLKTSKKKDQPEETNKIPHEKIKLSATERKPDRKDKKRDLPNSKVTDTESKIKAAEKQPKQAKKDVGKRVSDRRAVDDNIDRNPLSTEQHSEEASQTKHDSGGEPEVKEPVSKKNDKPNESKIPGDSSKDKN